MSFCLQMPGLFRSRPRGADGVGRLPTETVPEPFLGAASSAERHLKQVAWVTLIL